MNGFCGDDHHASESSRLVEEALELLISAEDLPTKDRDRLLEAWCSRSERHAAALPKAMATWAALDHMPNEQLGLTRKLHLSAETIVASVKDHSGQAGAAACLVASLFLAPSISDMFGARPGETVLYDRHAAQHGNKVERISTGRGEQRQIELPGGTTLWLNWNTEVLLADLEDGMHIDIHGGDVLFSIPETQAQVIIIHAGDAIVRSDESEFAVHAHSPQDAVFQVRKGSIAIASLETDDHQRIEAAQQTFFLEGEAHDIRPVSVASVASWQKGKLVFDERSLTTVLHVLGHYTDRKLEVGSIAENLRTVTATYAIDRADEVLVQLAAAYDLELLGGPNGETVVQSADSQDF